jgi:CDP-4-dehydro-6-deoxyglucose reductase
MPTVTLANNIHFDSQSNLTIIESAYLKGIVLQHSCLSGRCGACKALVIDGGTRTLKTEESLSQTDQSAGYILTCCRTAVTDIELDIEDLGELGNIETKTLPCRINSLLHFTDDVIEVSLRTPPASHLNYLPGQYINVIGKDGLRRSYSIANAPRDDGKLTLQIRKVPNGHMSHYWFDEAKANDLLRLEGPLGTFCLRANSASQLVMLSTGTGIAPIRAMLEQLAANPNAQSYRQIHVYWGGRTDKDLYWVPDYPALPLRFIPVLSRSPNSAATQGYVQDAVLTDGIDLQDAVVYACGSESMIASAQSKLVAAGLNSKNFHSDAFVSSNRYLPLEKT